jgi:hypothetical protein
VNSVSWAGTGARARRPGSMRPKRSSARRPQPTKAPRPAGTGIRRAFHRRCVACIVTGQAGEPRARRHSVRSSGPRDGSTLSGADGISGRPLPHASLQHASPTALLPCVHRRPNEACATGRSLAIGDPFCALHACNRLRMPSYRTRMHAIGAAPSRFARREVDDNLAVGRLDQAHVPDIARRLHTRGADAVVLSSCVQMPSLEAIAAPEPAVDPPVHCLDRHVPAGAVHPRSPCPGSPNPAHSPEVEVWGLTPTKALRPPRQSRGRTEGTTPCIPPPPFSACSSPW